MSTVEATQKYFLIDKIVITKNSVLIYDLYKRNSNKKADLFLRKGTPVIADIYDNLINQNCILYVHEDEKPEYDNHHSDVAGKNVVPQQMVALYSNFSNNMNQFFENPESMSNYKVTKENVQSLVSTVLNVEYDASSFLSTLVYEYYTHTHSLNVCVYAISLGKNLGLGKDALDELGTAAMLHDIGKSKIDKNILDRNGKLSEDEFKEIQKHPVHSWNILKQLGIKNKNILAGVRSHHEKLDGTGYPDNLMGKDIHIYAKIIGICDVFDAMTTKKTYKDSKNTFETLILMKKEMRNHLDSVLINHFILMLKEQKMT
ncbi:MAG: HD domain-containing phosphohydrolase [Arcobacteraceae bacterium]